MNAISIAENHGRLFSYSAFSSVGVAELILPHYALDRPVSCSLLQRGNNDSYVTFAAQRRYVLKVYRHNARTKAAILAELDAIEHLDAKGIGVAMPVRRHDGELITEVETPEGLRYAVLFNWLVGENPQHTDRSRVKQVGRSLAELHGAGSDIQFGPARPRLDLALLFDAPVRTIARTVADSAALTKRLNTLVDSITPHVDDAIANLTDWGFCHGDFDLSNVFVGPRQICFFDFDWCGDGWRPYDLATFRWAEIQAGGKLETFSPLVEGYLEIRPEGAAMVRFIPLFVVLRQLWIMDYLIASAPYAGVFRQTAKEMDHQLRVCEKLSSLCSAV